MILHLMSAGVPTTWTVVAAYRGSYGIAHNAAVSWIEKQIEDHGTSPYATSDTKPDAHLLIEMKKTDGNWRVERHNLLMSERYLSRQEHDERHSLFQEHTAPFPLEPAVVALVTDTLRQALVDFGYLISRDEWARRYPGQRIVSDHFAAFFAAERAHRSSGAEGDLPFELRWTQFMPSPEGFVWPFDVREDGAGWIVTRDGEPFGSLRSDDEDQARLMMRLLNSGYEEKDLPALMSDGPEE